MPISKAEFKARKSIRKLERDPDNSNNSSTQHNNNNNNLNINYVLKETINNVVNLNLSSDEKSNNTEKEMKLFKFRQNYDWIRKDIKRTFHEKEFTAMDGEEKLSKILEALSFVLDEIGYVQGMNFIAGGLLLELKNEEEAFFVFYIFLKKYDLIHLYKKVNLQF